MKIAGLCAVVLLSLAALCQAETAHSPATLASISPKKLVVNATYVIDGQNFTGAKVTTDKLYAPGMPILQADEDKVLVSYAVNSSFTANASGTVTLRACWTPKSIVDRPWRKANPVIDSGYNKQCTHVIATGLNSSKGTAEWVVAGDIGLSNMFVRAYVYNPAPAGAAYTETPVAYGDSVGFFQVQKVDSRPPALIASVAVLSCLGPAFLISYFAYDKFAKKRA
ncbi:hypothetical protein WJX72_005091 [[Myrmecia] bisecta]|uniref:High-affinity nitrate transporter n=1 Tax=[Myrmecia] bisecta TaxID=41462 RepID=A0AAW1PHI1_9CHLO